MAISLAHLSDEERGYLLLFHSVQDPDPDPPDPHVCGPPGSGSVSISQMYGSGSFYQQAKIVRKTLILLDSNCFVTSFGLFIFEK